MKSLSGVGLGLSVVFGCLLLALFAELYYLLWWKKRVPTIVPQDGYSSNTSPAKEFLYMFCWRKPLSLSRRALNPNQMCSSMIIANTTTNRVDIESSHDNLEGRMDSDNKDDDEFGNDDEQLMSRLHKLGGPPRFLFTIVEETKEDMESELDGKSSSRRKSLSDLLIAALDTPYLTPIASPSLFTPPLTPNTESGYYKQRGFNPLFESATDAEFNRMKLSPPPKFKFLQDAEEKLGRKVLENGVKNNIGRENCPRNSSNYCYSKFQKDAEDSGSFINVFVDKNMETKV